MYFYVSFIRPPLTQAPPSKQILITPQIANDLRTESFDDPQDIFYSWLPVNANGITMPTRPVKLTTWRPSNAFKEIPVPLPQGIREGQIWRLALAAGSQSQNEISDFAIDLAAQDLGRLPLPVMSMPILFSTRGSKGAAKQERVERMYRFAFNGISTTTPITALKITEQTSFDLDKKIWDSGIGLSSWLVELSRNHDVADSTVIGSLSDVLFSPHPRNIIELGAGTGIVSLTLAFLRQGISAENPIQTTLFTTDVDSAMPLLEHNISANFNLFSSAPPKAAVLDWENEELPDYVRTLEGGLDAIVMADVTYNTASFPSLVRTLSGLMRLKQNRKTPMILLGYKERDAAERTLWNMAVEVGIQLECIGERQGAGVVPVEIWIGKSI